MNQLFDVIIVGGGMVGAALACGLGGSDLRVAVIDNQLPTAFAADQAHDLRVSALSLASQAILSSVNAWDGILQRRYCPFKRMRVWETRGSTEFCSDSLQRPALGFIVENRIIQLALLDQLPRFENIHLFCPATIQQIEYQSAKLSKIYLENGQILTTKLIVAADGGQSRVRSQVGIGLTSWDYQQQALVIYVKTAYPQQDITWQRFVPTGPQAFLPLNGQYASLVWYHQADEIQRLKQLSYSQLMTELLAAFPAELGELEQILGTASFPLRRQHAQRYVKAGVALIGDAAHTINPLAGQGVNIGLLDAAALAEILIEANQRKQNIAELTVLNRYEKCRRAENLKMMTLMDIFYQVFSRDQFVLHWLRNTGLEIADNISPFKHKAMKIAMGLEGQLPKLARGIPLL
ncbi:MAG: 2-octaprenyl-3-methyl-6-methoxy,4-benzoquinol hydroxylase [Pseudomonadota bacterium]|jgi:2-octaprenyl-3-methyl-6-methoxy-1,4-benzoquinol hydroxylase